MHANELHSASIALLPEATRQQLIASLTDEEAVALLYDWQFWARPNQLIPKSVWNAWLILAGRGYGKTRTGAETVRNWAETLPGIRIALVGRTAADVRDVMVEGESGILAISPPYFMPRYEPSKRRLTWPNGTMATTYSGDKPDQLRGPQHHKAWTDELAAWRYPEAYDQLLFGLRLGDNPQTVNTTTPRPIPIIREMMKSPNTVVTRGSTFENAANLAPRALEELKRKYENTRLGRQELFAELLDDVPGALWKRDTLEKHRVNKIPTLKRITIAIDPAISANEDSSNETGITVQGLSPDDHGYMLDDLSGIFTPDEWARRAVNAYHEYRADAIVVEVNQGGDMVTHTIRTVDPTVNVKTVRATKGKYTRAEPVAALYEQGKVHHVGMFAALEDQYCTWVQGEDSPDRLDAAVWGLTELMLDGPQEARQRPNKLWG
jgi:phage terminase large subunit-like protein